MNLDKVLDSDTNGELHLGQIADVMTEWEGSIADNLDLSPADISRIKTAHPAKLDLQTYVIMSVNLTHQVKK